MFEESFLFSDSVGANIAYGHPDATQYEIEAAARAAQAHEFIEALPKGYGTVVGERGLTLSGGQRQRVALARALLSDPRILILDDATSAIDAAVEERIHHELRQIMQGRTTLVVAHRRSTLHLADRIAVVDEGHVVDIGTHDDLVGRSRLYRELLSGFAEEEQEAIGDRVEELAHIRPSNGVTAAAWIRTADSNGSGTTSATAPSIGAPSIGPGLGGGGGGWRVNLAPSPELVKRVAALRPVRDFAAIDLDKETQPDPHFTLPRLLGQYRRPLGLGLVLVVLDALASLAGPVLIKEGIDSGVATGSKAILFVASAVFLLVTLADFVDQIGETFVTGRTAQRIMLSLRLRIWAQLQRLSLNYYEREMAGRIMTRMTTDVDQFESLVENGLLSALVAMFSFVGVGVALLVLNYRLALAVLTVIVPLAIGTAIFRRRASRIYDLARDRIAVVNADFQESLAGVRESQAFVHESLTKSRFHYLGHQYLEARLAAQRLVATYFPFVQFLSGLADAVVLGVGAGLIASGHLTVGALIAFVLYIDLFFSPIQQLSQVFDSWQQTRVSVGRISELMSFETMTPDAPDAVEPSRLTGAVRFDKVRFAYPGSDASLPSPDVLKQVDLDIRPGETVALVGETGAGKSTVMKLLARFYDSTGGRVLVDGENVRNLDLHAYRSHLGYVPQEAFLFTGSIRDNIAYGRPDASDAEVEAAARAVGAHSFVAGLPGGYLHVLSERGRSLSAGQRQLIALARAELVDPRPVRHARDGGGQAAARRRDRRGRPARLHAGPHAQQQLHHPRRGPEHDAGADEDVPDPHRLRVQGRRHRRRHPDRPPGGAAGWSVWRTSSSGIEGLAWVRLGRRDVVRHRIVQDIVTAYESGRRAARRPARLTESATIEVFVADEQADHPVDTLRWVRLAEAVLDEEGVRRRRRAVDAVRRRAGHGRPQQAVPRQGRARPMCWPFPIDEEPVEGGRSPDSGGTGPGFTSEPDDMPTVLGDVVICPAVAFRNAPEHAGTYDDELALLIVHGVLHLLGMDHDDDDEAEAMEARNASCWPSCTARPATPAPTIRPPRSRCRRSARSSGLARPQLWAPPPGPATDGPPGAEPT